jgi:radical SAM protein with 4Fe4S-binding SPASM domain
VGRRLPIADRDFRPAYVVWELTLACDQRCTHCGSRAGDVREGELSTAEALVVARELGAMRAEEVVLIGGEAYLHPGFLDVVLALKLAGVRPVMTTGGRGVTRELARAMADAGLAAASVSLDGLEETHDRMRASRGGFAAATAALGHLREAGIAIAANTNVNRWNEGDLEGLYDHLRAHGVQSWQVQLTTPLGRAADRPDMILQPYDLLTIVPRIAALKERARADGILLMPGNNVGYFGPEEALLRSPRAGGRDHFRGCQAGRYVLGIESNGAVKGCPSLQPAYIGGNVRARSLRATWDAAPEIAFARAHDDDPRAHLWGHCATCDFADECRGGCTFTAHAFFGRAGNNPYCHYRARDFARRGLRERLVLATPAPGEPFDHGRFDLVVEPSDAIEPAIARREQLLQIAPAARRASAAATTATTQRRGG